MNLDNLSQMIQVLENKRNDHWIAFDNEKNTLYAKKKSSGLSRAWNTIFRRNCYTSIKAEMIADKIASAVEERFKNGKVEKLTDNDINLIQNSKKLIELLSTKIQKKNKNLQSYVSRIDTISTSFFREINDLMNTKFKHFEDLFIKNHGVILEYPEEKIFQNFKERLEKFVKMQQSFTNETITEKDKDVLKELAEKFDSHTNKKNAFIQNKYDEKFKDLDIQFDRSHPHFVEKQIYQHLVELQSYLTDDEWVILDKIYKNEKGQIQTYKKYLIENSQKKLAEIKLKSTPELYQSYLDRIYNQTLTVEIGSFIFEKMRLIADQIAEVSKIKNQMQGHPDIEKQCVELAKDLEAYLDFLTKLSQIPAITDKTKLQVAVNESLSLEKEVSVKRIEDKLKK